MSGVPWRRRGKLVNDLSPEAAAKLAEVERRWLKMERVQDAARRAGWRAQETGFTDGTMVINYIHPDGRIVSTTWFSGEWLRGGVSGSRRDGTGRDFASPREARDYLLAPPPPSHNHPHLAVCPACRALDKGKG